MFNGHTRRGVRLIQFYKKKIDNIKLRIYREVQICLLENL